MTNNEAQSYAIVALYNLLKAGVILSSDHQEAMRKLDGEMYYLMDRYSEEEIEEMAKRRMVE